MNYIDVTNLYDINSEFTCLLAPCPYVQMEPEWIFGMYKGEDVVEVGTCGENGYFNDTDDICTCTDMKGKEAWKLQATFTVR